MKPTRPPIRRSLDLTRLELRNRPREVVSAPRARAFTPGSGSPIAGRDGALDEKPLVARAPIRHVPDLMSIPVAPESP
jgi:hypothetical protein